MAKKLAMSMLIFICLVLSLQAVFAQSSFFVPKELTDCKFKYSDCSDSGAVIYGFNKKTLYSSMLLPDSCNRSVTVKYNIFSVCQCKDTTYALYKIDIKTKKYGLVGINMTSGKCNYYEFSGLVDANSKIFAVSGSSVFFIRADAVYCYVAEYRLDGSFLRKFTFDTNVYSLFCNNGNAYAMLYNGEIFRLGTDKPIYITTLIHPSECFSAGTDYICTESGFLVSLKDGTTEYMNTNYNKNCVVKDDNGIYTLSSKGVRLAENGEEDRFLYCDKNIKDVLVSKGKTALVFDDGECSVYSLKEYKTDADENDNNTTQMFDKSSDFVLTSENVIKIFKSSMSITEFKKNFTVEVEVYNSSGTVVTSGKIRTGYTALCCGKSYEIAVIGDTTGEGNIKSNDVSLLMSYIVGEKSLNHLQFISADLNADGKVDNKDLVLMARSVN